MPDAMTAVLDAPVHHVVLDDIRWDTYQRLAEDLVGERIRLTYDRGRLEITVPGPAHEASKKVLARLIEVLTLELDIPVTSLGSTTCKRADLSRGLEPDECYYIGVGAPATIGADFDLTLHPPPDLAIEVEVTHPLLDRRAIYAALGIPEVWTYDGQTLAVLVLKDGEYARSGASLALPMLPLEELERFLRLRPTMAETAWLRSFQQWVRARLTGRQRP
jgi:Uma2 family endonuclease